MTAKHLFFVLFLAGTVLPLFAFLPWLATHGLDVQLFVTELFANRISGFFAWDVIVSALVTLGFIAIEGRRLDMRRLWLPIAGCLCVGVSCGLPLFLWLREKHLS